MAVHDPRGFCWYERLLIRLLCKCPNVDELHIVQFPGDREERRQMAAQMRQAREAMHREMQVELLEELFQGPAHPDA